MQKPVYTHPTLREDATQDVMYIVFILDFCLSAKRKS